ncbi:MAG: hypothetical protein WD738_11310 [Pirellulales bacterium]
MIPNPKFTGLTKDFWANIRIISQHVGYTQRVARQPRLAGPPKVVAKRQVGPIKIPNLAEITAALEEAELRSDHLLRRAGKPTPLGARVLAYFDYRAGVLNNFVEPRLMNKDEAKALFHQLQKKLCPKCPLPMNKQKGAKKAPAYFTGIINMLIESNASGMSCDYDPRELTTVTRDGIPFRTLARRIDGAFPRPVNPIAVWEIKEYYYTTTFGSRVADGVYESLLDGLELEELRQQGTDVKHYLMIDDRFTWWDCGRSYLCRIIDMLHMGYVDEVLFGKEVVERLPKIVKQWVKLAKGTTG